MLLSFWQWLEALSISRTVRESLWLFPVLECIHIYSMIILVSIFAVFDLRLLGLSIDRASREPLSQLSSRLLRWGWLCFGINFITGSLLFSSEAVKMTNNWGFQLKISMIVIALIVHTIVLRVAVRWEDAPVMPLQARLVGGFSILLWVGVITASRWIAFIINSPGAR
jgi:uncharacterized protein DUF6644